MRHNFAEPSNPRYASVAAAAAYREARESLATTLRQ